MKAVYYLIIFLLQLIPSSSFSQEYSYKHYDIADGLASSTVYCIAQDRDGFIWVGTEAGVCRFDGTHFRTFTTADGLPDVEVLQIYGDSKGRVWMAPFKGSVCYYYQGKIHYPGNDSLLARLLIRDNVENFAEDTLGNILIQEKTALHLIRENGEPEEYDSIDHVPIGESVGCSRSCDGHFYVQANQKLYELDEGGFKMVMPLRVMSDHPNYLAISPSWIVYRADAMNIRIRSLVTLRSFEYPFYLRGRTNTHVSFSIVGDSMVFINRITGTIAYDPRVGVERDRFLPGKRVSRTFQDAAGNWWFTTIGNGIYRLNSSDFRHIRLPDSGFGVPSVTCINLNRPGNELLVGDDQNAIFHYTFPGLRLLWGKTFNKFSIDRVMGIYPITGKQFWWGTDHLIWVGDIRSPDPRSRRTFESATKAVCVVDDHRLLTGGSWGAAIFDLRQQRVTDTIWRSRISALYSRNDTNYIGTLHGLWRLTGKDKLQYLGKDIPFLQNRISSLAETPEGEIWVASYDSGLIGYKDGKVFAAIGPREGLVGNVCHCMYLQHSILWIGTDKGLNKIELNKPGFPVSFFNADDGLGSDVVNVIYAAGNTIFVGTPEGFSYFDETKAPAGDECRLNLAGAVSSGRNRIGDSGRLILPVKENNIRFEFFGISYRSAGKISYRYRLIGLDSSWKETRDSYLSYPTLPSGQYELQMQAINRFGNGSEIRVFPFVVATPLWAQLWFIGLEGVFVLGSIWLFLSWRIRQVRRQQEQKAMQSRRMAELEHIALQSQMNPHFIFNCLNSIQQFVFDKDMMATNEYISGFARLIRATLNHSSRPFICVAEEVEYLGDYLSLEKMRFKSKMDYRITVEPEVDVRRSLLPPMLLQPYVENSVRHGLRHKTSGQGFIHIHFRKEGEKMLVTIRDNGIGRKKALDYKTGEHIEYQSKGMSLTSARIQMIRVLYKSRIEVKIEDLQDANDQPEGTGIAISFPEFRDLTGQG
jgi:ligand-binding sensor domain-containing protein